MQDSKSVNQKLYSIDKDSKAIETTYNLDKEGSNLVGEKFGFILTTRAKPTKKKPKHFLLNIKDREYISSLYPTSIKDTYKFDYKGKDYTLFVGTDKAILTAL